MPFSYLYALERYELPCYLSEPNVGLTWEPSSATALQVNIIRFYEAHFYYQRDSG